MDEIHLPDEFRCPICDGRLKLFRYSGRNGPSGYPMIGCGNWGKCRSPWRRRPERFPWHVWVGFYKDGRLRPQLTTRDHVYLDEEVKRHEFLEGLISKIKSNHPDLYRKVLEFYDLYERRRFEGLL